MSESECKVSVRGWYRMFHTQPRYASQFDRRHTLARARSVTRTSWQSPSMPVRVSDRSLLLCYRQAVSHTEIERFVSGAEGEQYSPKVSSCVLELVDQHVIAADSIPRMSTLRLTLHQSMGVVEQLILETDLDHDGHVQQQGVARVVWILLKDTMVECQVFGQSATT